MTSIDVPLARSWITRYAELVDEHADELTELDSAIGDADHGINMRRGMQAVLDAIDGPDQLDALFKQVSLTTLSKIGGTAGPLYGTFFLRLATALGPVRTASNDEFSAALQQAVEGVGQRGKSEPGEKTMLDALAPAVEGFKVRVGEGAELPEAARAAFEAAEVGRDSTKEMLARKGRASYLGERSIGHIDPGATSATYLFQALAEAV